MVSQLESTYRLQSGSENTAQSLMHHHFATVCTRIAQFSPKCSEINTKNGQILNIVIKDSLFGSW